MIAWSSLLMAEWSFSLIHLKEWNPCWSYDYNHMWSSDYHYSASQGALDPVVKPTGTSTTSLDLEVTKDVVNRHTHTHTHTHTHNKKRFILLECVILLEGTIWFYKSIPNKIWRLWLLKSFPRKEEEGFFLYRNCFYN